MDILLPTFASLLATLTERAFDIPTLHDVLRVVRLEDYNTRVVVLSTAVLGLAAGLVGSFTLLRRRALMGDALAHATLPGICIAFIAATLLKGDGKSLTIALNLAAEPVSVTSSSVGFGREILLSTFLDRAGEHIDGVLDLRANEGVIIG